MINESGPQGEPLTETAKKARDSIAAILLTFPGTSAYLTVRNRIQAITTSDTPEQALVDVERALVGLRPILQKLDQDLQSFEEARQVLVRVLGSR